MTLRVILRRDVGFYAPDASVKTTSHATIDVDAPEVEMALKSGGHGPDGYELTQVVGVEIIPTAPAAADANSDRYLIWSNERGAWWRPARAGYTKNLLDAGRYSQDEAIGICRNARDGYRRLDMVPPEIPVREADIAAMARMRVSS